MAFVYKLVASWLWLLCILLITAQSVEAQDLVFSDDFSHGFEKWLPIRDDGSYWQIHQGRAEVTVPLGNTITELIPKDHYWDSAWQNLDYSFEFTPLLGVDRNLSFGVQDSCNWYEVHFVDSFFNLVRLKDCWVPFSVNHDYTLANGQTYRIRIRFLNGVISMYIDEKLISIDRDWSFNQHFGKIGLKAGTGSVYPTTVAYDNIQVWLLDDYGLGVPVIKQSDPRWSDLVYDSATEWSSEPTINRWGCALVSLVMIMQYHGLHFLPNGDVLTPRTLNDWLLSQVDGYLGNGLLNWVAASRLTFEMSQMFGTPKLEYSIKTMEPFTSATQQIEAQLPVILEIPGHFLVADGLTPTGNDLVIKDPAYVYTRLSQHQAELISTRVFTPSQTDLSFLVLGYKPDLYVELLDTTGLPITNQVVSLEKINSMSDTGLETTELKVVYLSKPQLPQYQISLHQPALQPFTLTIYAYDKSGNLTDLTLSGWAGPMVQTYTLDFSPDGTSSLQPLYDWVAWQQELFLAYQQHGFACWEVFWLLDLVAGYAAHSRGMPETDFWRLQSLQLAVFRPWIRSDLYRYFHYQLSKLR